MWVSGDIAVSGCRDRPDVPHADFSIAGIHAEATRILIAATRDQIARSFGCDLQREHLVPLISVPLAWSNPPNVRA
jgi:hypothetical protein